MKFLICIFLFTFCVFAQANEFILTDESSVESSLKEMDSPQVLSQVSKAAEQGDAYAQARLGLFYLAKHTAKNNRKVSKELKQSLRWFKESATRGNADAQVMLGNAYCFATSRDFRAKEGFFFKTPLLEMDCLKGMIWLQKSAEQGHPVTQPAIDKIEKAIEELSTPEGKESLEKWKNIFDRFDT